MNSLMHINGSNSAPVSVQEMPGPKNTGINNIKSFIDEVKKREDVGKIICLSGIGIGVGVFVASFFLGPPAGIIVGSFAFMGALAISYAVKKIYDAVTTRSLKNRLMAELKNVDKDIEKKGWEGKVEALATFLSNKQERINERDYQCLRKLMGITNSTIKKERDILRTKAVFHEYSYLISNRNRIRLPLPRSSKK